MRQCAERDLAGKLGPEIYEQQRLRHPKANSDQLTALTKTEVRRDVKTGRRAIVRRIETLNQSASRTGRTAQSVGRTAQRTGHAAVGVVGSLAGIAGAYFVLQDVVTSPPRNAQDLSKLLADNTIVGVAPAIGMYLADGYEQMLIKGEQTTSGVRARFGFGDARQQAEAEKNHRRQYPVQTPSSALPKWTKSYLDWWSF